jgi:uncharacterized membrane protein YidH (DUF202 family)
VIGAGFALLGVVCIGYAAVRRREVDRALARGEFARPDDRVVLLMTALGALLGLLVIVVVIAEG